MKHIEIFCILGVLIATCVMHQANQPNPDGTQGPSQQGNSWHQKEMSATQNFDFKNYKNPLGNVEVDLPTMHVPRRDVGLELEAMKVRANSR